MLVDHFLAAVNVTLISWWKALLIIPPFIPWAWLVSVKLDKDARYFHLNHQRWNAIHMAAGAAAVAATIFIPIFWVGWPVGWLILAGPLVAYWQIRNRAVDEDQQFHFTSEGLKDKMEAARQRKADRAAVAKFLAPSGEERPTPQKDDALFPIHMMAEDLLIPALDARASRVELAVGQGGTKVSQTVDGLRYKREALPTDGAMRLIDFLKEAAGLDVEDRRRMQDAEFAMRSPRGDTQLSITTSGTSAAQVLRIDFDRKERLAKPIDALGLLPTQVEQLAPSIEVEHRHGVILVGAPPLNGLTTSMYAFTNRHDAYTSNIKTLERQILVELEGIDQQVWDPTNPDVDYATHLQSILRRDPDIVMADEIKDSETAKVIADFSKEGPIIYVPQKLGSIVDQIRQWVKQVGDVKVATGCLTAVANQRLLRTLCPNCRQPFQPSADHLQRLGLPADKVKQLFRANGKVEVKNKIESCPVCQGSGYLGQTAVFEVLIVDREIKRILATGDLKAALREARRNKMIYLQEAALSKVLSGETTLDEVVRITQKKGEGQAAA